MSERSDPSTSPLNDVPSPPGSNGVTVELNKEPNKLIPHEPGAALVRFTLPLPPALGEEVKRLARERGLTATTLLQLLIRAGMLGLKAEEVGKPGSGLILRIDGEDHHILFP